MPLGSINVEGKTYYDFEQLLPIECKRLPTPSGNRRSDLEYVHGIAGHRTGGIERFKHGQHGRTNKHAMLIAYVQSESFSYWLTTINARLAKLADDHTDDGIWNPYEPLSVDPPPDSTQIHKLSSRHRRLQPPCCSDAVDMEHFWLRMN